ncbi:MAG: pilus assembly PilX N-terminal domain-containing protein [Minisyncoccia bacterium]
MFNIKIKKDQKGVALYLVILLLTTVSVVSTFLINFSVSELKILQGIGNSVIAFFAADTGSERILFDLYKGDYIPSKGECKYPEWQSFAPNIFYSVCVSPTSTQTIWSTGFYNNTKRKIELNFY